MMLSHVPAKKIKQVPDDDEARRLADEMQSSGHESLDVEVEQSSKKSLKFLEHFGFLKYLCVGGHARDLETIASLSHLKELCLLRVTVPDFGFLSELSKLRLFDMRFGGCKKFESLSAAKHLIGLSFLRLPTLNDLGFVSSMPGLQLLQLDSCKGVTELPDFSNNPKLRKLVLETMNGLTSLERVTTARKLESLVVMEAKELPPTEFKRVVQCPSLRKVLVGLAPMNSARYKEAIGYVPEKLQMDGYYGTQNTSFIFNKGYDQPPAPE